MSISTEVVRLQTAKNKLKNLGVELGVSLDTDLLDTIATKFEADIVNRGAVNANVMEGESYTIPKGYHSGSGQVNGVAGGGNYSLQAKNITPTKTQQNVTSDAGYYGLASVTVNPIPTIYQDVSSVTVTASEVLANKVFVSSTGQIIAGTMPNIGAATMSLDTGTPVKNIAKGYHDGTGEISITLENKATTPSEIEQTISATDGKVLSSVTIEPIPDNYKNTVNTNAMASDLLVDKIMVTGVGEVTGTMPNIGNITATIDGLTTTSYTILAGKHGGNGTVSLTTDIEEALASI